MRLEKEEIKFEGRRDIHYQKSFILDENNLILCSLIVCATYEYLTQSTDPEVKDMNKWFEDNSQKLFEKYKSLAHPVQTSRLVKVSPPLPILYEFANSL